MILLLEDQAFVPSRGKKLFYLKNVRFGEEERQK